MYGAYSSYVWTYGECVERMAIILEQWPKRSTLAPCATKMEDLLPPHTKICMFNSLNFCRCNIMIFNLQMGFSNYFLESNICNFTQFWLSKHFNIISVGIVIKNKNLNRKIIKINYIGYTVYIIIYKHINKLQYKFAVIL